MIKKKPSKKVSGVLDKLKRHTNTAKKNITYNVIDKVYKSANKKDKAPLKKAKELIKNTYLGGIHKDTKSHNVKINVLSGVDGKRLFNESLKNIDIEIKGAKHWLNVAKRKYKNTNEVNHALMVVKYKLKRASDNATEFVQKFNFNK